MGGIGQNLAKKAQALGMSVVYHNRSKLDEKDEGGARWVSWEELLRGSDVISCNLPLNVCTSHLPPSFLRYSFPVSSQLGAITRHFSPRLRMADRGERQKSTHHIVSTSSISQMKDSVVIINTARGAVIDEAALVSALDSGKVASAGLDVYEEEPKIHPGLVDNPRVTLLPHMGTWTVEVSPLRSIPIFLLCFPWFSTLSSCLLVYSCSTRRRHHREESKRNNHQRECCPKKRIFVGKKRRYTCALC